MPIHQTARTFGARRVPDLTAASGCWQLGEVTQARRDGIWPISSDELFSSVELLINADGTNGSTTFTDASNNALSLTANGGAVISNAQSKFGGTSASLPVASSSYITAPDSGEFDFGTGDFTIECWAYLLSENSLGRSIASGTGPTNGSWMFATLDGDIRFGRNFTAWDAVSATTPVVTNTWQHLAACRSSGTLRLFVDGAEVYSGVNTQTYNSNGTAIAIGARQGTTTASNFGFYFDGYIDEFRITSAARYTAAFTPAGAPFPTS